MSALIPTLLLEHFDDPYHRGECECVTHTGQAVSSATECQLAFEICVNEVGIVIQSWFDGAGCQVCEALASMLAEFSEGQALSSLRQLSLVQFLSAFNLDAEALTALSPCAPLALQSLQLALANPIAAIDGDLADGSGFGGPSLREEC